jgi:hypothetical protein
MTALLPDPTGRVAGSPPTLRALPVPDTEPAPDRDGFERPARVGAEQPTLALALVTTPVDDPESTSPFGYFGPQPTSTSDLPDPRAWAGRMVQAVLEAQSGVRPVAQLVRWTSSEVYAGLHRRAALAATRPAPGRRDMVRSVRVCLPADGIVEASAVVVTRGRVQAVALRLEGLDGRWRMTALELG